ncbi:MAG: hypothetical protein Q4P06_05800 [Actinomycetaceae bacterium]|nr:hypothetical protein [Actinomycetaceae bacterium]
MPEADDLIADPGSQPPVLDLLEEILVEAQAPFSSSANGRILVLTNLIPIVFATFPASRSDHAVLMAYASYPFKIPRTLVNAAGRAVNKVNSLNIAQCTLDFEDDGTAIAEFRVAFPTAPAVTRPQVKIMEAMIEAIISQMLDIFEQELPLQFYPLSSGGEKA